MVHGSEPAKYAPIFCEGQQEKWLEGVFGSATGFAVDVGANDGTFLSNTLLAEKNGWTVLCIEANPGCEPALRASRKRVEICACASASADSADFWINDECPPSGSSLRCCDEKFRKIQVPVRTVDELLVKHEFPRLDLLSIDVEHTDLDVLKGANLSKWSPAAIIVESLLDPQGQVIWGPDKEPSITAYLEPLGYRRVARCAHDLLFVKQFVGA